MNQNRCLPAEYKGVDGSHRNAAAVKIAQRKVKKQTKYMSFGNLVEMEFLLYGLCGDLLFRFSRNRSIKAVTSLRVARNSASALSISSAGAPASTASS
jgi:hypothetical protein